MLLLGHRRTDTRTDTTYTEGVIVSRSKELVIIFPLFFYIVQLHILEWQCYQCLFFVKGNCKMPKKNLSTCPILHRPHPEKFRPKVRHCRED